MRLAHLLLLGSATLVAGCVTSGNALPEADPEPSSDPSVVLDGGGAPATPPDGAALCPAGACNYQTGDGCRAASPACVPLFDASGAVAPSCEAAGAATAGASCAEWIECAPGLLCVTGICRKLCCGGDWTACGDAGEHCIAGIDLAGEGGGAVSTGAMVCLPVDTCDVLSTTGCPAALTCQIVDATGATACFPGGQGATGDLCPCQSGNLCAGGVCVQLCAAAAGGGDPSCPVGSACIHYTRDPAGVGECL
jgi:hypothetical protein